MAPALVMLLVLVVGFVCGWFARRWGAVILVGAVCLVVSVVGVALNWFADQDMASLGGAILLWLYLFVPLVIGIAVGVSRHKPVPAALRWRGVPRLPPPDHDQDFHRR